MNQIEATKKTSADKIVARKNLKFASQEEKVKVSAKIKPKPAVASKTKIIAKTKVAAKITPKIIEK